MQHHPMICNTITISLPCCSHLHKNEGIEDHWRNPFKLVLFLIIELVFQFFIEFLLYALPVKALILWANTMSCSWLIWFTNENPGFYTVFWETQVSHRPHFTLICEVLSLQCFLWAVLIIKLIPVDFLISGSQTQLESYTAAPHGSQHANTHQGKSTASVLSYDRYKQVERLTIATYSCIHNTTWSANSWQQVDTKSACTPISKASPYVLLSAALLLSIDNQQHINLLSLGREGPHTAKQICCRQWQTQGLHECLSCYAL